MIENITSSRISYVVGKNAYKKYYFIIVII